ncbi:hypothetical protein D3C86_1417830 [compost metagenome]
MKFVSAKKPVDHALQLEAKLKRIAKLRKELKELEADSDLLASFLRRQYPEGFRFSNTRGRDMMMTVTTHKRLMLNQAKAKKLLGARTPYSEVTVNQVRVVPYEEME